MSNTEIRKHQTPDGLIKYYAKRGDEYLPVPSIEIKYADDRYHFYVDKIDIDMSVANEEIAHRIAEGMVSMSIITKKETVLPKKTKEIKQRPPRKMRDIADITDLTKIRVVILELGTNTNSRQLWESCKQAIPKNMTTPGAVSSIKTHVRETLKALLYMGIDEKALKDIGVKIDE